MNKLSASTLGITDQQFTQLIRLIFDDYEELDEQHLKHSEFLITALADVDKGWANTMVKMINLSIDSSVLVGHWIAELCREESWGTNWSQTSEILRAEEVTETKTVTYWKPIRESTETETETNRACCSK